MLSISSTQEHSFQQLRFRGMRFCNAEPTSSLRGNLTSFGSSAVNTQSIGTRCAIMPLSSTSRKNRVVESGYPYTAPYPHQRRRRSKSGADERDARTCAWVHRHSGTTIVVEHPHLPCFVVLAMGERETRKTPGKARRKRGSSKSPMLYGIIGLVSSTETCLDRQLNNGTIEILMFASRPTHLRAVDPSPVRSCFGFTCRH